MAASWSSGLCCVTQHRPVREQPGRVRPWLTEGTAQADAWAEDRANGERGDPGHAFVQNLRRGHYELAVDAPPVFRLATAFDQLRSAV